MLQIIGLILGFIGGFGAGMGAIAYISRGYRMREILGDKDKKIWLGLLGWFFAFIGALIGWGLGGMVAYALR